MKLYTADEMSRADQNAQRLGIPGGVLMERAGVAITEEIIKRFPPQATLVVCGGGNNGGDGFVIARELDRLGYLVSVIATKDEDSGDAKTNLDVLRNLGIYVHPAEDLDGLLDDAALVVDALLGTGFRGEVRERESAVISAINASKLPVVSVDMPSGVNGSTGEVAGAAIRATLTVCPHAAKVGCVVSPGLEFAGEVSVVGIGLPKKAGVEPSTRLTTRESLAGLVPRISGDVHKYSAGAVMAVAGSRAMTGAAVLVVGGAQRAGCGTTFLAVPESTASALDLRLTETLVYGVAEDAEGHTAPEALDEILAAGERASAFVIGPGIGVGDGQRDLLEGLLREVGVPMLLDADAITNLVGTDFISRRTAPTILTPHAGELGRLLGTGAEEVSSHRLQSACRAAEENGCVVLLKGADTLVAGPGRAASVNTTGSVALATGGTGDVLAGAIAALLARGMEPFDAARAGAWVHGRAAELWLEETGFPAESLAATDLSDYLPRAMSEVVG